MNNTENFLNNPSFSGGKEAEVTASEVDALISGIDLMKQKSPEELAKYLDHLENNLDRIRDADNKKRLKDAIADARRDKK